LNDLTRNIVLWVVIAVVLLAVFSNFGQRAATPEPLKYSQFLTEVRNGGIKTATFKGESIVGERASGGQYITQNPETDNSVVIGLLDKQRSRSTRRRPSASTSCSSSSFPRSRSCC